MSQPLPRAIGRPATRALEAAGYGSLDDLHGADPLRLLALHGIGPKAIRLLRPALAAHGWHLGDGDQPLG